MAFTQCTSKSSRCSQESHCTVRGNWQRINSAIRQALNDMSLAAMVRPVASHEVDVGGLQLPRRAQV